MRELYKATAMVIVDVELRKQVSALANTVTTSNPSAPQPQPDPAAVGKIDALFQTRGLHMPVYDVCEINRWFMADKDPENPGKFSVELERFRNLMKSAIDVGASAQNPGFFEAVGVMVADPLLRAEFAVGARNLSQLGFRISPAEEEALRITAQMGGAADAAANTIHDLGWPGGSCLSAFILYPNYVHPNR